MGVISPMILGGWCPVIIREITKSFRLTNIKHVNISISTSDQMIKGKFEGRKNRSDILKMMVNAVREAKKLGAETVGVNAEDASRTNDKYLIKFAKAARDEGASRFRYCDTLGYNDPFTIYQRIGNLVKAVKIPIELHCHNDLGMAVACSVAGAKGAIDAGVDAYINTSINGMGERAGNADLLSVILAVKRSSGMENKYFLDERIDISKSWKISKYASYAFGIPIPINQVGVGENAFAHESGIHADGALKDSRNYELYDFRELGRGEPELVDTGRKITAGEYSGIKGFRNIYDKLEVEFHSDAEAVKILELVRYANVHTQKPLTNDELKFIACYPEQARKILTVTPP
ncbi:MAG: Citrate (Re)-synthase [Syntrophomonadaceae bacterium]|nr:Citrate (Re)-synthase [Bacillota bacterium]